MASETPERIESRTESACARSAESIASSRAFILLDGGSPKIEATSETSGAIPQLSIEDIFSRDIKRPRTPRASSVFLTRNIATSIDSEREMPSATRTRCSASSWSVGRARANSTHLERLVRSIFSGSVVASMNITCGGGSSRSFKKACPPSRERP